MIKTLLFFLGVFLSGLTFGQFEGVISFSKITPVDTTRYIYYVKGNHVRIDEVAKKGSAPVGSFLVDLGSGYMVSLSPERKLFMEQKVKTPPATVGGKPLITKPKEIKNILGTPCKEYTVTNKEEEANITYYVGSNKCEFFPKLLKTLNRKDKLSLYYLLLKDIGDGFPFLANQRNNEGKDVIRLEVTKFEAKTLEFPMFEIPKGYNKFQ